MIPPNKLVNTVNISKYRGVGSRGEVYDEPVQKSAWIESRSTVAESGGSQEILSTIVVYLQPLEVPERSKITLWVGTDIEQEATVAKTTQYREARLSHTVLELR